MVINILYGSLLGFSYRDIYTWYFSAIC